MAAIYLHMQTHISRILFLSPVPQVTGVANIITWTRTVASRITTKKHLFLFYFNIEFIFYYQGFFFFLAAKFCIKRVIFKKISGNHFLSKLNECHPKHFPHLCWPMTCLKQLNHRRKVEKTTIELFRYWIIRKHYWKRFSIPTRCIGHMLKIGFMIMVLW